MVQEIEASIMGHASGFTITTADLEHFRRRADQCRAAAEVTVFDPGLSQRYNETALAYERMAARGQRFLAAPSSSLNKHEAAMNNSDRHVWKWGRAGERWPGRVLRICLKTP